MHLIFLHTEVTCERTIRMQGCMASKMSNRYIEVHDLAYGMAAGLKKKNISLLNALLKFSHLMSLEIDSFQSLTASIN